MTVRQVALTQGSSVSAEWGVRAPGLGDVPGPAELTALGHLLPAPVCRFEDPPDRP